MARVLVVDDDPLNCEALRRLCAGMGLEVSDAANGREALEKIIEAPPHVVLLDLLMPELDGFGVLEGIRDRVVEPRPAVILVTAAADVGGRMRGTELGAIDFVEKPFRLADLQRRIQRALAVVELEARLKEAERTVRSLRNTDALTGLGSFGQLYAVLEAEFRCAELTSRPLGCVLLSDEAYSRALAAGGREAGEQRLQRFVAAVEAARRPADYVFRIDAAELVVLCPATDATELGALAASLRTAVLAGADMQARDLAIAMASYPNPQIDQASLLYRAANVGLAQARSRADGEVVYFERF